MTPLNSDDIFDFSLLDSLKDHVNITNPKLKPMKVGKTEFYFFNIHPSNRGIVDEKIKNGELINMGGFVLTETDFDRAFPDLEKEE